MAMKSKQALSELLSEDEKLVLIDLIGSENSVISSGVCQLLVDHERAQRWTILAVGIVCLVKDRKRRIYCIRYFDCDGQLRLDQRLYQNFDARSSATFEQLIQFEGDHCVFGLNFADQHEARSFKYALQSYESQRQKRAQAQVAVAHSPDVQLPPPPQPVANVASSSTSSAKKKVDTISKKKKKKLTRHDIGLPSQFRHLSHFDITPEKSFVKECAKSVDKLDPRICSLLEKIGESAEQMNPDEQEFVLGFIDSRGGMTHVERELTRGRSPLPFIPSPTPTRSQTPTAQDPHFYSTIPRARIAAPPPPPPPPPSMGIPRQPTAPAPPPPPIGGLLSPDHPPSINRNESLPGDLMAQIQRGKQLRRVETAKELAPNKTTGSVGSAAGAGIAAALAKALADRRGRMNDDDASDNEQEAENEGSDDDDWD